MTSNSYIKWLVVLATGIMVFLANVDFTIVNLATPTLVRYFNASFSQVQWVVSSYLIATFIFFIVGGRFADMFGKKRIFLIGVALFTLSCLGAALASNLFFLDMMRFVQGIGFAFTLSLAILLNSEAFPDNKKGLVVGITIAITSLSQVIGPVLGGLILHLANWRWLFAYAVPLGTISFILIIFFVDKDSIKKSQNSFVKGMLDKSIWQNKRFLLITAIRVLFMFSWTAILFSFPVYLQEVRDLSVLQTGLLFLVLSSMMGITAPFAGNLSDKHGPAFTINIACFLTTISFLMLVNITSHTSFWLIGSMFFIFGIAAGLILPASIRAVMKVLTKQNTGMGMGVFFTANFFISACAISIVSFIISEPGTTLSHMKPFISNLSFQLIIWTNLALCLTSLYGCRILHGYSSFRIINKNN